jgi:hypothetical protein
LPVGSFTPKPSPVAEIGQLSGVDTPRRAINRTVVSRGEMAGKGRQLGHYHPVVADHVIDTDSVEARIDLLVAVVCRGSFMVAFPVGVLVHVVVAEIDEQTGIRRQSLGADIEDAAAAGTGIGLPRRQECRRRGGQKKQFHGRMAGKIAREAREIGPTHGIPLVGIDIGSEVQWPAASRTTKVFVTLAPSSKTSVTGTLLPGLMAGVGSMHIR